MHAVFGGRPLTLAVFHHSPPDFMIDYVLPGAQVLTDSARMACRQAPGHPPASPGLRLQVCALHLVFMSVLGVELLSSHLCGKHFTD